jgi:hypothetical protein
MKIMKNFMQKDLSKAPGVVNEHPAKPRVLPEEAGKQNWRVCHGHCAEE